VSFAIFPEPNPHVSVSVARSFSGLSTFFSLATGNRKLVTEKWQLATGNRKRRQLLCFPPPPFDVLGGALVHILFAV